MALLDTIDSPADLKRLPVSRLPQVAEELRRVIIQTCSTNGGHLAPSLGVVELTIALHRVFSTPEDKIVWDVGHQAYAHKLLTGRRDRFSTLRKLDGISGFPKRDESPHDAFEVGHASTSISAATGLAAARDLAGRRNKVLAVIGDGSMTGGMAYEAMNHAGHMNRDMIVILNDNEMSIAENVGALSNFLTRTGSSEFVYRFKKNVESFLGRKDTVGKNLLHLAKKLEDSFKGFFTPGMLFEAFGFEYIGPIDGHDLPMLLETLEKVKKYHDAVLIHVLTKKGKGYKPAEDDPSLFHGVGPFDLESGRVLKGKGGAASYTAIFGSALCKLAADDERVVAITAAMPDGTGLIPFSRQFPKRFFDVGIAEQHAVTFAAGLATQGFRPVFTVYSSFLQRAYDLVFHDVCLQNLPVIFALDRAGVVGNDGPTHHGSLDISLLRHLPNMTVMAPRDENELQHMLATALGMQGPVALRYPRGNGVGVALDQIITPLPVGRAEVLREGKDGAVLALGSMVHPALEAALQLERDGGPSLAVVNARFVKPLDEELIQFLARTYGRLITLEENALQGGFGSAVLELLEEKGIRGTRVLRLGYPDAQIPQGDQGVLRAMLGLDPAGLASSMEAFLRRD
ncbi:1-deoxy-D-xylulose-5-phosphate synthase [Pelobacter propionicus]|uniref:1-deoxy-D-xylulose-5-phosphate synthase n=1 Tax=Pelobacter propionicus (strain DSM 2379 / NBRC 103807 / OttBd1) TaxID=338966 RepID=A1ARN9_PELPD|nr:1-deoxy-D-xylulose-5-phosphate synthase [Pelobacter propionicus]ABL00010.1 1-deoxy-D-xylulose-5-phosphate synthase [Pelobacter propionicus DSM 2379]